MGEGFALFRDLGAPSLVSYAAVTHTTSRRRMSAFVGGKERVVRMTLISEGSE